MSELKSLRYDMWNASDAGKSGHPKEIMDDLHIEYRHAIPQSMADQWWFIDCNIEGIKLPAYLEIMEFNNNDRKHWGV